jgi:ArsR family transcriptional regulator
MLAEHAVASMRRVVTTYFRAHDELEPVTTKGLRTRLREGSVVLLDVRPEDEYGLGHLPGGNGLRTFPASTRSLPTAVDPIVSCRSRQWPH